MHTHLDQRTAHRRLLGRGWGRGLGVVLGLAIVAGGLAAVPSAHAADDEPTGFSAWTTRVDGPTPAGDRTYSWVVVPPETQYERISAGIDSDGTFYSAAHTGDRSIMRLTFRPPGGGSIRVGETYPVGAELAGRGGPDGGGGVTRSRMTFDVDDDTMCDRPDTKLAYSETSTLGWIRFHELEVAGSTVTRLSATYELNCQVLVGSPGLEGSLARNASQPPPPVPDRPETPGPVTDVVLDNVGPLPSGWNHSTVRWRKPEVYGDAIVTALQESDSQPDWQLPAHVSPAGPLHHRVPGESYTEEWVDAIASFSHRITPRGPTGRLGPSTTVRTQGVRMQAAPVVDRPVFVGDEVRVTGTVTESYDYGEDTSAVMKGPPIAGQQVDLCIEKPRVYTADFCTVVDTTTSAADGSFGFTARPRENTVYTTRLAATPRWFGNTGYAFKTLVAPHTDLRRLTGSSSRTSSRTFTTSKARTGSRGIVRLQRLEGPHWRTVATRDIGRSNRGRLAITVRGAAARAQQYRVVKPGDRTHVDGYSPVVRVR